MKKFTDGQTDAIPRNIIRPVKSMFENLARRCSRRHKQMTFSDVGFFGI